MNRLLSLAAACIVSLCALVLATPVSASGQAVLHFYNAQSGITAIGRFGTPTDPHEFQQYDNPGTFSPGWTHMVTLKSGNMFVYNGNTGAGAYVRLGTDMKYSTMQSYDAGYFSQGWNTIADAGNNRLFFYRASDGLGALATVDLDGQFDTIRSYVNNLGTELGSGPRKIYFSSGTTSISDNRYGILLYNRDTGAAEFGTFTGDATYRTIRHHDNLFSPGWTNIAYLPSLDLIAYYNAANGGFAVGRVDASGNHTTLSSFKFTPGFTSVVALPGKVFLYNAVDGAAALVDLQASGESKFFAWPAGVFSPGWTSIIFS